MVRNPEGKYPNLFDETVWEWGPIRAEFVLLNQPPPENKRSNINLVPKTEDRWVILQHQNGDWDIPGATLSPEKPYRPHLSFPEHFRLVGMS